MKNIVAVPVLNGFSGWVYSGIFREEEDAWRRKGQRSASHESGEFSNSHFFADIIESGKSLLSYKRKTHGITFEISDKFLDDDLTAGFRGMYFTSNEGSAAEIFAEYKIGDNWQIAPGFMLFNGPKDSRLGQFSHNDMIYLRLRYSF